MERLGRALSEAGETVVASKEPTDGQWGKRLRESAKTGRMSLADELHAFTENRREHLAAKILPALSRGEIVTLDRYFYSTIAYQGSRGANVGELAHAMREEFPRPDLVLFIDTHPAIAVERIEKSRGEMLNHFEQLDSLTAERSAFSHTLADDPVVEMIDGNAAVANVFDSAAHTLLEIALRTKRCAKRYECDIFYCTARQIGECRWAILKGRLAGRSADR